MKYELKCMKRVLRRLGYTNEDDIIETKGRVACEINAADELVSELNPLFLFVVHIGTLRVFFHQVMTEMIFAGAFNDLTPEQVVSVMSCFVFGEKVDANLK